MLILCFSLFLWLAYQSPAAPCALRCNIVQCAEMQYLLETELSLLKHEGVGVVIHVAPDHRCEPIRVLSDGWCCGCSKCNQLLEERSQLLAHGNTEVHSTALADTAVQIDQVYWALLLQGWWQDRLEVTQLHATANAALMLHYCYCTIDAASSGIIPVYTRTHTLGTTLHYACCYDGFDEIKGIQDLKIGPLSLWSSRSDWIYNCKNCHDVVLCTNSRAGLGSLHTHSHCSSFCSA